MALRPRLSTGLPLSGHMHFVIFIHISTNILFFLLFSNKIFSTNIVIISQFSTQKLLFCDNYRFYDKNIKTQKSECSSIPLLIPYTILHKKFLTSQEWKIILTHSQLGKDILETSAYLRQFGPWVLYHHERFDGSGYPAGLEGEQIPLESRIIARVWNKQFTCVMENTCNSYFLLGLAG